MFYNLKYYYYRIYKLLSWYNQLKNQGTNTYIHSSVQVIGWKHVKIGDNSIISEDTWINVNHRQPDIFSIKIGNNCFIGRRNFLNSGGDLEINDYCLTGPDCCFLGSDHVYDSPFTPYIATGATKSSIKIGVNCWLGAHVNVLKNVSIGYGSVIGASTLVNRNIPPFSLVVGNPCRIIKRFDISRNAWVDLKDYHEDYERFMPTESKYLAILKKNHPKVYLPFLASSKIFSQ